MLVTCNFNNYFLFLFFSPAPEWSELSGTVHMFIEFYTSSYEFDADLYEKSFFIYVWYDPVRPLIF